jgi:threonine synthase
VAGRPPSLWRYHELLPVGAPDRAVTFGEGMTPLVSVSRIGRAMGVPGLLMKDESPFPTATFKARGASIGVSRAAELGAAGVAMPTNGNAGAAWSASSGLRFRQARPRPGQQILCTQPYGSGSWPNWRPSS